MALRLDEKGDATSRGCGTATKGEYSYVALYTKFILKHYARDFPSGWEYFNDCKIIYNELSNVKSVIDPNQNLYEIFHDLLEAVADTSGSRLPKVASACHNWIIFWFRWKDKMQSPVLWERWLMVGFEACLPKGEADDQAPRTEENWYEEPMPVIFENMSVEAIKHTMDMINIPMEGSVKVKEKAKAKTAPKKRKAKEIESEKDTTATTKKEKEKSTFKPTLTLSYAPFVQESDMVATTERTACWVDEMEATFDAPFNVLRKHGLAASQDPKSIDQAGRMMLSFLLTKEYVLPHRGLAWPRFL